jgi:arginase
MDDATDQGCARRQEHMQVSLIQVPYIMGDELQGSGEGPERLVKAGAGESLSAKGLEVAVELIDRGGPFRDSGSASLRVCKRLASVVQQSVAAGRFPLVLGGGCDISKGVLSGFDHSQCGVVWFDAHGDFNTPESTISGYLNGMSLAVIAGHCYTSYWSQVGNSTPIPETAILLLGVRELDLAERDRLERSAIQVVKWHEGKPTADVESALHELARRVPEVYLHIDIDCLAPEVAPGVVNAPVPGGLSLCDLTDAIRITFAAFRVRAASLTGFNHDRDENDETLHAGLQLIESVGECVARLKTSRAVPA